jgi:ribonuclease HII
VAAAVILSDDFDEGIIKDSKKLSPAQREKAKVVIEQSTSLWGIGIIESEVVDQVNILQATFMAMRMAVERIPRDPDIVLVDGNYTIPDFGLPQKAIIGGDNEEKAIAAASILAKTYRDKLMIEYDEKYPGYGFAQHKGYGTRDHISNLSKLGPCPIHRRSFKPVSNYFNN